MCSRTDPGIAVGVLTSSDIKSPLRSVENKIELCGGQEDGNTTPAGKMNNQCSITTKIKTEPFTDNYTIETEIGRGKFAVVKRCKHKKNGNNYAAKFLRKRRKGKDCRHEVVHEIAMLETAMLHPRLVDLVEVYETSHELILVTEYACGGELYQTVVLEERLHERHVIRMMRQVLEGVAFLHDRNIVHLDVKPQNILLTQPYPYGDIKLCDFGFARTVNSGDDIRDIIGTPDYVAPEVLSYEPIHTSSDMWSIGVLAYVMLTGYSPFAGDTKQETFLNISQVNLEYPDDLFEDVSLEAQDFMSKLLVRDPHERMTAKECRQHHWLQGDENLMEIPREPRSPFGSPIGQRRALTPTTPDSSLELEPTKKCRCDVTPTKSDVTSSRADDDDADMVNGNDENTTTTNTSTTSNCTLLNNECLNCSSSANNITASSIKHTCSPSMTSLTCSANNISAPSTPSPLKENKKNTVNDVSMKMTSSTTKKTDSVVERENLNNEKATTSQGPKIEELCCEAFVMKKEANQKIMKAIGDY